MERDSLRPEQAREYIRKAGGTAIVAAHLGVPFDEVVRWARLGVESVDHSIAIVNLAFFGPTRTGRGARCALVTLDELWTLVERFPNRAAMASALGVCDRALRRYLSGERVPPPAVAERILAILSDRVSPDTSTLALPGYAKPDTETRTDHLSRLRRSGGEQTLSPLPVERCLPETRPLHVRGVAQGEPCTAGTPDGAASALWCS